MANFSIDRIFSQAAASVSNLVDSHDAGKQLERKQVGEEEQLRRMTAGMTAADAIQRILLAEKDKDYFRMLELPLPELDALGRAVWDVPAGDVSRAYRKLSILVHPDKNPGDDARKAFEALNQAHRALKDPSQLEEILREEVDNARARRDLAEGRATLEERVVLNAKQKEQAKELRKAEGAALNEEIVRQMRERQERAKQRKEAESKSRYRRRGNEEGSEGDDDADADGDAERKQQADGSQQGKEGDSDDEGRRRRQAIAQRRKKQRVTSI